MKKTVLSALLLVFAALPAVAEETASAATAGHFPTAIVATVDMQKLMQDSVAAKSVRDQLNTRRQSYQQDVQADEKKLRETEQKLAQERTTLTQEQFNQKKTAFEADVRKVQQRVQDRGRVLDVAFNDALATIKQTLGQIIAEAASEKGATLVLDKGQVIVVESTLDMTATVLERLNRKLPRVDVKFPAEGQAGNTRR